MRKGGRRVGEVEEERRNMLEREDPNPLFSILHI